MNLSELRGGGAVPGLNRNDVYESRKIPLPPLEVQLEIVAELENYQEIIEGARQVVENYKPAIRIDPNWEMVEIKKISKVITKGSSPRWQGISYVSEGDGILFITSENVGNGELLLTNKKYVEKRFNEIEPRSLLKKGDILTNIVGASIGRTARYCLNEVANINQAVCLIRLKEDLVNPDYFTTYLNSSFFVNSMLDNKVENARANISMGVLGGLKIPLPPLEVQEQIVLRIKEEQKRVQATKELVEIFEQKIKDKIAEVWGENPSVEHGENASSNDTFKHAQLVQQAEVEQAELGLT